MRITKRLPGGKLTLHHVERNPQLPKCSVCKEELKGIPRVRPYKMEKLGASKKRASRPYANLCSKCSRLVVKQEARQ